MGGADGGSKDIQTGTFDEFHRLLGIGQLGLILGDFDLIFHPADGTKFALHRDIANLVAIFNDFFSLAMFSSYGSLEASIIILV